MPVVTSVPVVALYDEMTASGPDLAGSRRTASVLVPKGKWDKPFNPTRYPGIQPHTADIYSYNEFLCFHI